MREVSERQSVRRAAGTAGIRDLAYSQRWCEQTCVANGFLSGAILWISAAYHFMLFDRLGTGLHGCVPGH